MYECDIQAYMHVHICVGAYMYVCACTHMKAHFFLSTLYIKAESSLGELRAHQFG